MVIKDTLVHISEDFVIRKFGGKDGGKRLICFPPAGGASIFFKNFSKYMLEEWEIWAIDPPGHGLSKGKPLENIENMVDYYFKKLRLFFADDFYLMGYSLGGLVAYVLANKLESIDIFPKAVIICGTTVPHCIINGPNFSGMSDEEIIKFLVESEGIPKEVAEYRGFIKLILPLIRADFNAFHTFGLKNDYNKIKSPVWLFGGENDKIADPKKIVEWDLYCSNIRTKIFNGSHFFIQSHPQELAKEICDLSKEMEGDKLAD